MEKKGPILLCGIFKCLGFHFKFYGFDWQAIKKERVEEEKMLNELKQTGENLLDQMGKGNVMI